VLHRMAATLDGREPPLCGDHHRVQSPTV